MDVNKSVSKHILDVKPYIPGKPVSEVQRELGLKEVYKLASNENLFGPSPKAIDAIKKAATEVNYYPDGGCWYLRDAIAKKFGVQFENVVVGNGTDELIRILCSSLLSHGDEIIFADPSFVMYKISAMICDATIVTVGLREDLTHDLGKMLDSVTDRTKLLFVCNPNNPTGTIARKKEVEDLLNNIPSHVTVAFDEAYYEYVGDADYPQTLDFFKSGRNVVVLRTFSKAYGLAGLRVGYGFVSKELGEVFHRIRNPFNVNQLAQEAALAALADQDHLMKAIQFNSAGLAQLRKGFDDLGLSYGESHSNFILVNVEKDSLEVFNALLKKGIIVRPGAHLGFPTHLRVSVADEKANGLFLSALKEVLA